MTCPICERPTAPQYRPFCCARCADIDLGKWMTGQYSVPSAREEEPELPSESGAVPDRPLH